MKLKSILKLTLAVVVLICGCADLQAQKKSSTKKKTTSTTNTTKKNYPPISQEFLNNKELVLSQDMGDGELMRVIINLDFNDLSIFMAGAELVGTASISGNTLTIKSGALLFTLNSTDGGYHFTGTIKNTSNNRTNALDGYIFAPKPGNISQETKSALLKGEYISFLEVVISKNEPVFSLPVTVTYTQDPEDPNILSYKVKGTSKIMSVLGTLKGEIEFNEEDYVIRNNLRNDNPFPYSKRNLYSPVFYIGTTRIQGVGNADLYLQLFKKNL